MMGMDKGMKKQRMDDGMKKAIGDRTKRKMGKEKMPMKMPSKHEHGGM